MLILEKEQGIFVCGEEGGIRTPGAFPLAGFQDRIHKPTRTPLHMAAADGIEPPPPESESGALATMRCGYIRTPPLPGNSLCRPQKKSVKKEFFGTFGWLRTNDLLRMEEPLYQLSYKGIWGGRRNSNPRPPGPQPGALTQLSYAHMATARGLEPPASGVTGRRSTQLSYAAI